MNQQLVVLREPNSSVAESFRSLRATLSRSLAAGKRTFAIVSSWGGEGKSMVSANLAACLTQLFMDVVLVDGDIRRPTLTSLFDRAGQRGFTDWLEHGGSLDELLVTTHVPGLKLLPAGASLETPANLLGRNGVLAAAFEQLRRGDRCVIVDTSPLSSCSDPLLVASHTEGAIMVVNPRSWEGEAETRFKQELEDHGVELLGVVLNGADAGEDANGRKYGGYGYGYGQPEAPAANPIAQFMDWVTSRFSRG